MLFCKLDAQRYPRVDLGSAVSARIRPDAVISTLGPRALSAEDRVPWLPNRPRIRTMGGMVGRSHGQAASNGGAGAKLPPRWFVVGFWHAHRALLRVTRGRFGLWRPRPQGWGTLWLTTTGRRSGEPRRVVLGYIEDGANLVTIAMNGWGAAEPAWWLNLQTHPEATLRTRASVRRVRARPAQGLERERLWARWSTIDTNLNAYAALRPTETAVVILEPAATGRLGARAG